MKCPYQTFGLDSAYPGRKPKVSELSTQISLLNIIENTLNNLNEIIGVLAKDMELYSQ